MKVKSSTIYIVGAILGVLLTVILYVFNNSIAPIGAYVDIGKVINGKLYASHENNITIMKSISSTYSSNVTVFNLFFLIGMMLGGIISSKVYKKYKINFSLPELFVARFGKSLFLRVILSLVGGFIMGLGGVIASGCSLYYGISAIAQLNITGFATFFFFILGAYLVNKLIYMKGSK